MNAQQASNLLNVATALREASRQKLDFTMMRYGTGRLSDECNDAFWDRVSLSNSVQERDKNTCGTPACAIGHYASRFDLQDIFRIDAHGDLQIWRNDRWRDATHDDLCVLEHFGIDHHESTELFDSGGCGHATKPLEAAKFIENFLNDKGWVPA